MQYLCPFNQRSRIIQKFLPQRINKQEKRPKSEKKKKESGIKIRKSKKGTKANLNLYVKRIIQYGRGQNVSFLESSLKGRY